MSQHIDQKLDTILEKIGNIDVTLGKQEVTLAEHIRRTALIEADMKPVKAHVAAVQVVFKLVGVVAMLGAIAEGVMSVLEYLRGK
jgi:hypothetical protein